MSSKPVTIEKLTDGVLSEILHRLPFHVLLQCKSVNKQFLRVISDPRFFHPRLTHHQLLPSAFEMQTMFLLFHLHSVSNYNKIMLFSIDSNNNPHILRGSDFLPRFWPLDCDRVRVKGTHFDLVLCSTRNDCYTFYFVCNPFTKQYVALPKIRKSHAQELPRVGFICDQSRSRFRVMHIPVNCFQYVSTFEVNMFSSETGEWSAFNVSIGRTVLSNSSSRNIFIYNEKFVWWMKELGFFVCDPFNGGGSMWQIRPMRIPYPFLDTSVQWYTCNGRVKACSISKACSEALVYEFANFEQGTWFTRRYGFEVREVSIKNMNLLAFHPHCEDKMYLYSEKGIFLCDFENQNLKHVFTEPVDEDMRIADNVMSLVLPEWPTPIPTLNATNNYLYD